MFLATNCNLASEAGSLFILVLSEYECYFAGYWEKYNQMKFQLWLNHLLYTLIYIKFV